MRGKDRRCVRHSKEGERKEKKERKIEYHYRDKRMQQKIDKRFKGGLFS
jgi:hypothetical protein